jgi:hypothetical protein
MKERTNGDVENKGKEEKGKRNRVKEISSRIRSKERESKTERNGRGVEKDGEGITGGPRYSRLWLFANAKTANSEGKLLFCA